MLGLLRIPRIRSLRWILILSGIFLILSGLPVGSYSIGSKNIYVQPYLAFGASLIILGFSLICLLIFFVNQKISLRKTQIIIGLIGQVLLGIVILGIPLLPNYVYSPYNLHTYSIVLGTFGIAISVASLVMIGNNGRKQKLSE